MRHVSFKVTIYPPSVTCCPVQKSEKLVSSEVAPFEVCLLQRDTCQLLSLSEKVDLTHVSSYFSQKSRRHMSLLASSRKSRVVPFWGGAIWGMLSCSRWHMSFSALLKKSRWHMSFPALFRKSKPEVAKILNFTWSILSEMAQHGLNLLLFPLPRVNLCFYQKKQDDTCPFPYLSPPKSRRHVSL